MQINQAQFYRSASGFERQKKLGTKLRKKPEWPSNIDS